LPEDRKLLMTEENIDTWLAAHFGLTLDKIPPNRPPNMPKYIHEKLKR
jgi:hypothetical protein